MNALSSLLRLAGLESVKIKNSTILARNGRREITRPVDRFAYSEPNAEPSPQAERINLSTCCLTRNPVSRKMFVTLLTLENSLLFPTVLTLFFFLPGRRIFSRNSEIMYDLSRYSPYGHLFESRRKSTQKISSIPSDSRVFPDINTMCQTFFR